MLPAWQASTNLLLLTPIQSVLTGHATARECHRVKKHSQNGHLSIAGFDVSTTLNPPRHGVPSRFSPPGPGPVRPAAPISLFSPAMSKCHLNRHCLKQRDGTRPVPPTIEKVGATVCGWWTWAEFRVR
ncbi:hypothetical protein J3E68DRAFT_420568 [Trichoderma sp. SZMC 28012]